MTLTTTQRSYLDGLLRALPSDVSVVLMAGDAEAQSRAVAELRSTIDYDRLEVEVEWFVAVVAGVGVSS